MNDSSSTAGLNIINAKEQPRQKFYNLFTGSKSLHTCFTMVSISQNHFYYWGDLKSRLETNIY